ncbi:MAG: PAS domain S-box protein [Opitutaceae bacterium]|nr:PAS domain S-box protein [Opitutaceae bacterium]
MKPTRTQPEVATPNEAAGTPAAMSPTFAVGHARVLAMIASGAPLRATLQALLEAIELECPDMITSILLVDGAGRRLMHGAAPSLAEDFIRAASGIPIAPSSGSCGTAAWRRETVEVTDIATDPLCASFRDLALGHGLRACWSTPILCATGRLLGTFAVYYRSARLPEARHRDLVAVGARSAAIAIERAVNLEQLHHDKALLETTQERAHLGIWELNLDTQETTWSRELYRLLGRNPALGPTGLEEVLDYVHPDDRESVVGAFEHLAHDVRPAKIDFRSNPAHGPVRCFAATMHLAPSVDTGRPVATVTIMDVTESRRSEQALHTSEERLRLALRSAHQGIFDWDLRRGVAEVSPEYIHLLEQDPAEFHETTARWLGSIHPDDAEHVAALHEDCLRGKSCGFSVDYRIQTGTGAWKWVHATGQVVVRDSEGRPVRMLGTLTDISTRKTMELALRRSEERYRQLIDQARDAVIALDADGRIESLNTAFETLTGDSRGPWLGRHLLDLVHEADRERASQRLDEVRHGHVPSPFEVSLLSAGGARVPVELTLSARVESGQVAGMLAVGRDITERRQLEHQVRHSQRLDSIGQLAGGVAHDFNNILTVIHGAASILRGSPHFSPALSNALHDIERAAERGAHLTRQLLTFSRRQAMQPADVDLNAIVSNLARLLARVLGEDIVLRLDLDPLPLAIHADAGMLEQVLVNFAVNARDAMPTGGMLAITTRHMVITPEQAAQRPDATAGRTACLTVSDSGCGIPPDVLPRIFEPFFTTKPEGKGTGLGLATVFGIVRQHGGWIEVQSEIGSGTLFRVLLPEVTAVPAGAVDRPELPPPQSGSETILLAEDEAYVRAMVRTALERQGYRVVAVENGPAALARWHEDPQAIDLLLTDIVMPEGMSGYDLADALREQRPDLPIIFSSGYDPEMLAGRRRPDASATFLRKPYDIARLLHAVRACLDRV